MRYIVIGGDDRAVRLVRLLLSGGDSAFPLALEKALPVQGAPDWQRADAVILPLPWSRNGELNAPLARERADIEALLSNVPPGTPVLAGKTDEKLEKLCLGLGLPLRDYFMEESLAVKNAALTAEGAVRLMLEQGERSLGGRRVLICGFGRIGRLLALRLRAMGARVSAAARSAADRAWAEALDCRSLELEEIGGDWDFVINTIPAQVLGERELEAFGDATLIELASAPYGFDMEKATEMGKKIILAPGIPGWAAPESAAEALRDCIYQIMEE